MLLLFTIYIKWSIPLWLLKTLWWNWWAGAGIAVLVFILILIGDRSHEIYIAEADGYLLQRVDYKMLNDFNFNTSLWTVYIVCTVLFGAFGLLPARLIVSMLTRRPTKGNK